MKKYLRYRGKGVRIGRAEGAKKPIRRILLLLLVLCMAVPVLDLPQTVNAATVEYIAVVRNNDFDATNTDGDDTNQIKLSGVAALTGDGSIRLVDTANMTAGAAYLGNTKMSAENGFSTFFNIYIGAKDGTVAADGWMFVISKDSNQLGVSGGFLGYSGVDNSIGIEYDTFSNGSSSANDPTTTPHVAYGIRGGVHNATPDGSMVPGWDNPDHNAVLFNGGAQAGAVNYNLYGWVDYDPVASEIYYYLSTTRTRPAIPILTIPSADIAASGIGDEFYIGFNGAVGGARQQVFLKGLYIAQDYHPGGLDPDGPYVQGAGLPTAYIAHTPGLGTVDLSADDIGLGVQSGIKTIQYAVTPYGTPAPSEGSSVWTAHQNSAPTQSGSLYLWPGVPIASGQTIHVRAIDKDDNISDVVSKTYWQLTADASPLGVSTETGDGLYAAGETASINTTKGAADVRFTGWTQSGIGASAGSFTSQAQQNTTFVMPDAEAAVTANWVYNSCNVAFDVQNAQYTGTPIQVQQIAPGTSPQSPAELSVGTNYPQYGNKKFLGWFTDPTGGSLFGFGTDTITADTTLYGHWQQQWTVTFANTNGNVVAAQTVADGTSAYNPGGLAQTGYVFYGWSADPAATPTASAGVNTVPYNWATPINADTTIYGVWDPIVYSVLFDVNGGDWDTTGLSPDIVPKVFEYAAPNPGGGGTPLPTAFDPTADIPANPVRVGYIFVGWKDAFSGDPAYYDASNGANVTYYAQWFAIPYAINYDFADTPVYPATPPVSDYPHGYDMDSAFPLPIGEPMRPGYEFIGYTCSVGGIPTQTTAIRSFSIAQGTMGVVDLTAHWKAIIYDITYVLGGGVNATANPQTYSVDSPFPLLIADPAKVGYTFMGWTAEGGLAVSAQTKDPTIPVGTHGDITFTAGWTVINDGSSGSNPVTPDPSTPEQSPGDKLSGMGTAQTGDDMPINLMLAVSLLSLCGLLILLFRLRRIRHKL